MESNMDTRVIFKERLEHGQVVFFTGAGISFALPAGLPLGKQIIDSITSLIINNADIRQSFPDKLIDSWEKIISQVPMELIWETLVRSTDEGILSALKILESGFPNKDHISIALACERFNVRVIFTLNFDLLHEKAFETYTNLLPISIVTKEDFLNFLNQEKYTHLSNKVYIIHLHNALMSADYKDLITTVSKVGTGLPRYKQLAFKKVLENNDVICAGYSNGDVDTFPVIAGMLRSLFWYKYGIEEELPSSVKKAKDNFGRRFVMVERLPHESGFGEMLCSLDATISSKIEKISEGFSSQKTFTPKERINEMEHILVEHLGTEEDKRTQRSRLFLAILLDELGRRDESLRILQIGISDNKTIYVENMVAGHVAERLGDVTKAIQHFLLAQDNARSEREKYEALLERSSAHLGVWKRFPHKISNLLIWLVNIKKLSNTGFDKIEQRRLWEIGDFAQFIADYLIIPSTIAVWKIKEHLKYAFYLNILDRISLLVLKPARNFFLKLSAKYYFSAIKLAMKLDEDTLPNYTGLSYIRAAEVIAALGKRNQAKYLLGMSKKGEAYYEWTQSQHGFANSTCASAIVSFYAKDFNTSQVLFESAIKQYGSHSAGILKCKIFLFRLLFWQKWLS